MLDSECRAGTRLYGNATTTLARAMGLCDDVTLLKSTYVRRVSRHYSDHGVETGSGCLLRAACSSVGESR